MKKTTFLFCLFFGAVSVFLSSCEKETFTTNPNDKLTFSLDTLMFDTVFTEIGSITKSFKVINTHNESIRISNVKLAKQNDFFHINVDGISADNIENIDILPNDSIYIFVEVVIDPNLPLSASPFIVEEYVLFTSNGNEQKILLTAWGQNAVYLPYKNGKGIDYRLNCESSGIVEWNDDKPYVIYGRIFIDSCELIVPPGTEIYVHGGLARGSYLDADGELVKTLYNDGGIIVFNNGRITINGTVAEPVTIQGDRLDEAYQDKYGQWFGFFFANQSRNNTMNHTIIKNAIRGIYVDSASELSLKSCIISNTLGTGIEARHATVNMKNTLVYNNLSSAVQFTYGGNYNVDHCTFVSDDNNSAAFTAINYTCTDFSNCTDARFNKLKLNMNNNIVFGDQDDELVIIDGTDGTEPSLIDYQVNNNLIKMKLLLEKEEYSQFYKDCIPYENDATLFLNSDELDYHLDTFSLAENRAIPLLNVKQDLDGKDRDSDKPDIGCYEF